jgi:hypothetical protein
MKFVMTSAAEAELGALYTTAKEIVPPHQTPQPCTLIQVDNSTVIGITNLTIVPQNHGSLLIVDLLPRIATTVPLLLG